MVRVLRGNREQRENVEMKRGRHIAGYLAIAAWAMLSAVALPCMAQKGFHPAQQRGQAPRAEMSRPQVTRPMQGGHAGDWLRRYKDLPPEEQERALQNDPVFRRLPPAQQQLLRQRLQHFSSLPPQQQLRMLNRMETWEHLTPEQKEQARHVFSQFRQLPPGRRMMVATAVHHLREMPPDQREQVINSDRFKGMFSDQERDIMRGATRLPLAPADEGEPQE